MIDLFDDSENIINQIKIILKNNKSADIDINVKIFNAISKELKEFVGIDHPVLSVQLVKSEQIQANDYNPNSVAPPEMKLLYLSIKSDGITQPIVGYEIEKDKFEVVDGYHRNIIIKDKKDINESTYDYIPIVLIDKPKEERKASTIRHNRARGKHGVKPMTELVKDLVNQGWDYNRIQKELGMSEDEVLRLHQMNGLAEMFKNKKFNRAWE
jgi:ParB-like chromosome segregation protein Spo0J